MYLGSFSVGLVLLSMGCARVPVNDERGSDAGDGEDDSGGESDSADTSPRDGAAPPRSEAPLSICAVPDPLDPLSGFDVARGEGWASYSCRSVCPVWQDCVIDAFEGGAPLASERDGARMRSVAYVTDSMGGVLTFTGDGDATIAFQAGGGGNSGGGAIPAEIQRTSSARTVVVRWMNGEEGVVPGGLGWFTRKSADATTLREQTLREATVLRWIHDELSGGFPLGTVACSGGTLATLGAVLWHGLDPIIDYQLVIGGWAAWDINGGCGRVRYATGHCDADAAPCASDADCAGAPGNLCRMDLTAPIGKILDYVHDVSECSPTAEGAPDDPYLPFDDSSWGHTATDWELDSPTDFIADEGGRGPATGDERKGIAHAMWTYQAILGPKRWIDHPDAVHCDSWSRRPDYVAEAADLLRTRLDL